MWIHARQTTAVRRRCPLWYSWGSAMSGVGERVSLVAVVAVVTVVAGPVTSPFSRVRWDLSRAGQLVLCPTTSPGLLLYIQLKGRVCTTCHLVKDAYPLPRSSVKPTGGLERLHSSIGVRTGL